MGFSRQEYWSGLLLPSPGNFPNPGIAPWSPTLQANSSPFEPRGKLNETVGWGTTAVKSKPIPTRWATHKLEKIIPQKLSHRSESAEPYIRLCSLGVPKELGFGSQQSLTARLPYDWGKQKFHSWTVHKSLTYTRTQDKKSSDPRRDWARLIC